MKFLALIVSIFAAFIVIKGGHVHVIHGSEFANVWMKPYGKATVKVLTFRDKEGEAIETIPADLIAQVGFVGDEQQPKGREL